MRRVAWAILVAVATLLAGCNNNPLPDGAVTSSTLVTLSGKAMRRTLTG